MKGEAAASAGMANTACAPTHPSSRSDERGGRGRGGGGGRGVTRPPRRRHDRQQVERQQHGGHRRQQQQQQQQQQRQQQQRPPVIVTVADFRTVFHSKMCRAARYKVHAPNCTCNKVARLRTKYAVDRRPVVVEGEEMAADENASSGKNVVSSTSPDVVDDGNGDDVCDGFDRLNLNATTPTKTTKTATEKAREDGGGGGGVDYTKI